jgi:hypothetical protein
MERPVGPNSAWEYMIIEALVDSETILLFRLFRWIRFSFSFLFILSLIIIWYCCEVYFVRVYDVYRPRR